MDASLMFARLAAELTNDEEKAFLTSVFVADAASLIEDGHDAQAVAAALAVVSALVAGKAPESPAFLRRCKQLARKYRGTKLHA